MRHDALVARLCIALCLGILVLLLDSGQHAAQIWMPVVGRLEPGARVRQPRTQGHIGVVTDVYGTDTETPQFVTVRWDDDNAEEAYVRTDTLQTRSGSLEASTKAYVRTDTLQTRSGSLEASTIVSHLAGAAAQNSPARVPTQPVMKEEAIRAPSWSEQAHGRQRVAILAACRSTTQDKYASSTPLQSLLLPSIVQTVTDRERESFDVRVYVALDLDDMFWVDSANQLRTSAAWLQLHVRYYPKVGHRIPFNELAQEALDDGAEVFVRVNDDTEFLTSGWITLGVTALRQTALGAGVVGPDVVETASKYSLAARESSSRTNSPQGQAAPGNGEGVVILTHDMVTKTHLDIFTTYYPVRFDAWYVDDWITQVYKPLRSELLPGWRVAHHNKLTRYNPNTLQGGQLLEAEVRVGQERVRKWMAAHAGSI
jgi:hypothetical protein